MFRLSHTQRYWFVTLPGLNLLLALSYLVLAKFGVSWSAASANITLIWPAAGMALFSLLVFGPRVLPGLVIGSALSIQWLFLDDALGRHAHSITLACALACAAIAQAWLIASLNKGVFTNKGLVSWRPTLRFIGTIGLGALLSSSLSVNLLHYQDLIPRDQLLSSWSYWWAGDTIGMLVVTSFLARALLPRIRRDSQAQGFLLLCACVGLVIFLLAATHYLETAQGGPLAQAQQFGELAWYLPSWLQLMVLAMGLVLIGLLAAYINTSQKHDLLLKQTQCKLEEEVLSHTQALRKANDWLLNEVLQRQQAQEQLQASQVALRAREQHLRSLLDNIPDPVWFKNLQGVYISCNQAFADMLRLSEAEIIGKHETQLVDSELAARFQENDQLTLDQDTSHRYEQLLTFADQRQFLLDTIKVALHDESGKVAGILGIGRDISAQKETEHQLSLAKEVAEEATQAKSRFLANMSHEIRTPLNAILGYTQLLMRDEQFTEHQRERLQAILVASQRLLGLINDVLDLSKIESGMISLRQEHFDLYQELMDIETIMNARAQAKGLQLITQVDLPNPFIVLGDRQKIGQILLNLLGNAIKFTPSGSVSLYVAQQQAQVEFVIGDTGPGISEEELAELFSAFKQGRAGEDVGGTGLGLILSRHLAQGMGGQLVLSSALGQGTLAQLHLPLTPEAVTLTRREHSNEVRRLLADTPLRVLVVEDDPDSSEILVDLLRQIGCATDSAANGREGLAACAKAQFDIVFTDIRMPALSGLDMLRQLRALPGYAQTPIVAVSASSLEHEQAYYLAQGFQEFIGKPYAFEDIFNALRKLLEVRFEGDDSEVHRPAPSQPSEPAQVPLLNPIQAQLHHLAAAAASGDMGGCKKIVASLSVEQLGQARRKNLASALQQYDLERVEALVKTWLSELTEPH